MILNGTVVVHLLLLLFIIGDSFGYKECPQSRIKIPLSRRQLSLTQLRSSIEIETNKIDISTDSTSNSIDEIVDSFHDAWISILSGNSEKLLVLMRENLNWSNPLVTGPDIKDGFNQFSNFFQEPNLVFFDKKKLKETNTIEIQYQLSFWYPLPWRPRIIIPGIVTVKTSPDNLAILSVEEKWDITVWDIFLRQVPPRFWDLWHAFSSPVPEYPPIRELAKIDKVTIVSMPQTVAVEVMWTAPARFPGPPILAVPAFALFGLLRTSRPNRDPYCTVLPVEASSGRFKSALGTGEDRKRSVWSFHVPTSLQRGAVMEKVKSGEVFTLRSSKLITESFEENVDDDFVDEVDYQQGLENAFVMKSISQGAFRGDAKYNLELMAEFEREERIDYRYKMVPRRIFAQTEIKGEQTPEKIAAALKLIRETLSQKNVLAEKISGVEYGKKFEAKTAQYSDIGTEITPMVGFQFWGTKVGFNPKGEPAIAVYEMQYNERLTKVQIELEMQ